MKLLLLSCGRRKGQIIRSKRRMSPSFDFGAARFYLYLLCPGLVFGSLGFSRRKREQGQGREGVFVVGGGALVPNCLVSSRRLQRSVCLVAFEWCRCTRRRRVPSSFVSSDVRAI